MGDRVADVRFAHVADPAIHHRLIVDGVAGQELTPDSARTGLTADETLGFIARVEGEIAAATVFLLVHVPAEVRQLVRAQVCDHQPPAERVDVRGGPVREPGQRLVVGFLRGDDVDACERIVGGSRRPRGRRMQALACCRRDGQNRRQQQQSQSMDERDAPRGDVPDHDAFLPMPTAA
jgi:hypothetical protein